MRRNESKVARDLENPDPHELHKPIPKVFLALVIVLFAWAIWYIALQAPGLGSSSTTPSAPTPINASAPAR